MSPVRFCPKESKAHTRCVAIVKSLDLLHYINSLSLAKQAKLARMKLEDVLDTGLMNKDVSVPSKASLFKLMWFMSRGTYRVMLSDNKQVCLFVCVGCLGCLPLLVSCDCVVGDFSLYFPEQMFRLAGPVAKPTSIRPLQPYFPTPQAWQSKQW